METKETKESVARLLNRKDAAAYMGRGVTAFDKIKHRYRVVGADGIVRYDRVLMDRDIDLARMSA